MSNPSQTSDLSASASEREILRAVRDVRFGTIEVVVHEGRVMEIRQTKKVRLPSESPARHFSDPNPGG
jgi:hypothetical protein